MKNGMHPIHPGEILRADFLEPLGITPHALSKALHVTPARISEIVREHRGITADTTIRLARYFGGDPKSWLNLQQAYDLKIAEKAVLKQVFKDVKPLSKAALARDAERFALPA